MFEEGLPLPVGFVARVNVRVIPLTQGQYTLVEADDYEELSRFKWCVLKTSAGDFYATRMGRMADGRRRLVAMHRQILGLTGHDGLSDHINLDKLDNRRSNLRRCTQTENNRNSPPRGGSAGFKGVHFHKARQRFTASITVNRHRMHIGIYDTAREAAIAYDAAAREHFGEFAYLNFPGEVTQ